MSNLIMEFGKKQNCQKFKNFSSIHNVFFRFSMHHMVEKLELVTQKGTIRLDIRLSRLDIRMSGLDKRMSRLDIHMSVPTMLVLFQVTQDTPSSK